MLVQELMTPEVITCDITETVAGAARKMRDHNTGSVVVLQNNQLCGLLTDRQIALRAVAEGVSPEDTTVDKIMTEAPAVVRPDEDVFHLLDTMRSAHLARRVPVVRDGGEVVGVVSISDVAVVATRFIESVLHEERHHATKEVHLPTGGKEVTKRMRSGQRGPAEPGVGTPMQRAAVEGTFPGSPGATRDSAEEGTQEGTGRRRPKESQPR